MKTRNNMVLKVLSIALALFIVLGNVSRTEAQVILMDDVTEEMCSPSYWYSKNKEPDKLLTDNAQIKKLNQDIVDASGTGVSDLKTAAEIFDGVAYNMTLKSAGIEFAQWCLVQASTMYTDGGAVLTMDSFEEAINNTQNKDATETQNIKYGVAVNRTAFRGLPTDMMILDEETDYNFDYLYQSSINVNDPLIIKSVSADGDFYYCIGTCLRGWVPAEDVAICENKQEWIDAWDFDSSETLVIYGDRVTTETTRVDAEVSKRALGMGTVLRLVPQEEWGTTINNRSAYYNHVVWMPVREDDGTYRKGMALISLHAKASEGYLPLTYKNISEVAFSMLGNTYGWGGMLQSNDCSGYVKDIYRCFGIITGSNTTTQANIPVKKYDVRSFTTEERKKLLDNLPLGSVLIWSGHEMLYLGSENGNYYVINSVSSVKRPDGKGYRVRNVILNTLDIQRRNGVSWLDTLETMEIPYVGKDHPLYDYDYTQGNPEKEDEPEKKEDEKDSEKKQGIINIKKTVYTFTQGKERSFDLGASVNGGIPQYFSNNSDVTVNEKGKVTIKKDFVGAATITITVSGDKFSTAAQNVYINVKPSVSTIKKLQAKKRSLAVTFKKVSNVTKYEIQYSTNKKFKNGVTGKKLTKKPKILVKGLKSHRKYYVRVRSYKAVKVNGISVKLYSKWSKTKTVKIK